MLVRVHTVFQILTPISSSAHFQVTTPDTTYAGNVVDWASETVYYGPEDFYDWCAQVPVTGTDHDIRGIIPYDRSLFITIGAEGDSLRFSYSAVGVNELSDVSYNPAYDEYLISLWTNHPCLADLQGDNRWYACYLTLAYADTEHVKFDVVSLADTMDYDTTMAFRVIAMSEFDRETPLEENPDLELRIAPSEFGRFITQTGDTAMSPLPNIPYQDAREGRITFLAFGTLPDSVQPVMIEAVQMNDTTKRGADTVYVRPVGDSLRIQIPERKQIWPTLQIEFGGNPNNRNRKDSILVHYVKGGGGPAAQESLLVQTRFVVRSGGHDHDNMPPDSLMGTLRDLASTLSKNGEIRLRTNDSGKVWIRYTAPAFGGKIEFIARSIADTNLVGRDSLTVQVDSLIALAVDTTYVLVGGTCNHHGPRTDTLHQNCRTPDNNHWIVQMAADSLTRGAHEFLNARWNQNREQMRLNDMSLPFGGLFDISGQWHPAHDSHRTGNDVDIENINRLTRLRSALEGKRWRYIPEGPGFFPHFRFR